MKPLLNIATVGRKLEGHTPATGEEQYSHASTTGLGRHLGWPDAQQRAAGKVGGYNLSTQSE